MDYFISIFQNASTLESGAHDVNSIYDKTLLTLQFTMTELLLTDKFAQVKKYYAAESQNKTVLKLLMRCKKMLEAKKDIYHILG